MTQQLITAADVRYGARPEILTDEETLVENDFELNPKIGDLIGLAPHEAAYSANSRTIKMRDRKIMATDDTVLASLTGMSTTATKMTDPHDGTLSLFITFRYLVTAHGYQTGPGGLLHSLYFMNRDGGIMFSHGFPYQDFTLKCGWVNHQGYYVIREPNYVSWFDEWRKVRYSWGESTFYPC